jgi:hypothetical protein
MKFFDYNGEFILKITLPQSLLLLCLVAGYFVPPYCRSIVPLLFKLLTNAQTFNPLDILHL